jgi:hypothetical protein
MPPAGAIMTAAGDDDLGSASKAGREGGILQVDAVCHPAALACAALTVPGLGSEP